MQRYNPKEIEPKWQKFWEDSKIYQASEDPDKPKRYVLEYFPYPSGAAMHVGHVRNYTIGDAIARFSRMQGNNVLHPMGWDAFGLPAENYAIKTGTSPRKAVDANTQKFKRQLMQMGFSYDWTREIDSTDPNYYKWTQWFFLLLYKRGLAYQQESLQWWCPVDKTVLANEQVEAGKCWRCGNEVEKKSLKQWFFKITDYADRLLEDLDDLNWSEAIKSMQRNWIGKSRGAEIDFKLGDNFEGTDFVFLHGFKGSSKEDFWPELKRKVEEKGGIVYAPDLPNASSPSIDEQVDFIISNYKFSEKTVLVTHSLGGVVAMKLLPKLNQPINQLIMVAPPLRTEFLDGKKRPELENASDWKFDFDGVRNKALHITVIGDNKDDIVPISHPEEIATLLDARFVQVVAQKPHFNSHDEPEVFNALTLKIKVFTTRPDTLFGATFIVLSPEHELLPKITTEGKRTEVEAYIKTAQAKSDIERQETEREKTGVFTGSYAINPVNGEKVPVWVADYVLHGYGTGAIMAVPAHDERDWEFAKKFDLPITQVFEQPGTDPDTPSTGEGVMKNSGAYDGLSTSDAREKIVADLVKQSCAEEKINYKIRDWLISRQRYWGAPIPMIHCPKDGVVPVPEDQLPVKLPELEKFEPSGDGRSPLANVPEFLNTTCPKCGGKAERETDTMDGFACSSWYFLRFADPDNAKKAFAKSKAEFWLPVDDYIGGAEHAVMHLLYARFWTKVMFDEGLINFEEPFRTLRNQGMILAPDGQKMSKSKGNTIEPDELLEQGYGADSVRIMELFIGPWNQSANWSVEGMGGAYRFLQRVWTLVQEQLEAGPHDKKDERIDRSLHLAIKNVSQDLHELGLNTAIASLMECVNEFYKIKVDNTLGSEQWKNALTILVQLVAPFAPHIAEELWHQLGQEGSVHISAWPSHDEDLLETDTMTIVVQVNGKLRAEINVSKKASEDEVIQTAKSHEKISSLLQGQIKKTIYVPGRLVNFVI